jgi:flagellar hook assembly protein FlgD
MVSIRVYDVSGQLVRTLVDEFTTTGRHDAVWDGRNNNGETVTTGVYFYRMTAPGYASQTLKMLLLK